MSMLMVVKGSMIRARQWMTRLVTKDEGRRAVGEEGKAVSDKGTDQG